MLTVQELAPVTVYNVSGSSPLLIVADHAGNSIPHWLGRLGVSESDMERHIGWDIGIAAGCHVLADALDATLILQNYSRLVIDCNRPNVSSPRNGRLAAANGSFPPTVISYFCLTRFVQCSARRPWVFV